MPAALPSKDARLRVSWTNGPAPGPPSPSHLGRGEERMPPTLHNTAAGPALGAGWSRLVGAALPATLIGAVLVFIVPVPPAVLDLLLALNITLAVIVLLTTLSIRAPHEFGAFPTIILTT